MVEVVPVVGEDTPEGSMETPSVSSILEPDLDLNLNLVILKRMTRRDKLSRRRQAMDEYEHWVFSREIDSTPLLDSHRTLLHIA